MPFIFKGVGYPSEHLARWAVLLDTFKSDFSFRPSIPIEFGNGGFKAVPGDGFMVAFSRKHKPGVLLVPTTEPEVLAGEIERLIAEHGPTTCLLSLFPGKFGENPKYVGFRYFPGDSRRHLFSWRALCKRDGSITIWNDLWRRASRYSFSARTVRKPKHW